MSAPPPAQLRIHPEVREALADGRGVVALETAVVTHGLPRHPIEGPLPEYLRPSDDWDVHAPIHLEIARAMSRRVRSSGAVPAIVAVLNGDLVIGLTDQELQQLAEDETATKASDAALATVMSRSGSAGTTVSGTLAACRLAAPQPIRVFATGGIGGVHRDWTEHPDISADLAALARTNVCTVCSGAKSILDVEATLEALEALSIPVLGFRTDQFPMFHYAGPSDGPKVTARIESPPEAASICVVHWQVLQRQGAVLVTQPVPEEASLDPQTARALITAAHAEAGRRRVRGAAVTPFLLSELAAHSGGATLKANLALLLANAQLAGAIAADMTRLRNLEA